VEDVVSRNIPIGNRFAAIDVTDPDGHTMLRALRYTDATIDDGNVMLEPVGGKPGARRQDWDFTGPATGDITSRVRGWCEVCDYDEDIATARLRKAVDLVHAATPEGGQQILSMSYRQLLASLPSAR
jgi:hypothetical protein